MKAVICPVCNGKGTICDHPPTMPQSLHPTCPKCHGCGGYGWVSVYEGYSLVPVIYQVIIRYPSTGVQYDYNTVR